MLNSPNIRRHCRNLPRLGRWVNWHQPGQVQHLGKTSDVIGYLLLQFYLAPVSTIVPFGIPWKPPATRSTCTLCTTSIVHSGAASRLRDFGPKLKLVRPHIHSTLIGLGYPDMISNVRQKLGSRNILQNLQNSLFHSLIHSLSTS